MCEVEINNIAFNYGDNLVVPELSLKIAAGELVAVVGPNGAGKSTLLKLIAGLLNPSQGQIKIANQDIAAAEARGLIGYVPQNYGNNIGGFPATVAEIVALGLITGSKLHPSPAKSEHIVQHMLKMVGADELSNRRIGALSGGQQQRVMVARALAGNPELLLLDEPTSGVDFAASNRIFQLLGQLNHNLGITVIMVTHDIAQATQWATKVACINRGLCFYDTSERFRTEHAQRGHMWF